MPTEFYGLLGLPIFTSDRKEIKAAHRRVVKMVHPDVLGVNSGALQAVVTQAYETLGDDDKRAEYDQMLRRAKPTLAQSRWAEDAPDDLRGCFVDETACVRCYRCVDFASSTFGIHADAGREEKAHVMLQFGDAVDVVRTAVQGCPAKAIRWVSREDLPLIEYAMTKCNRLRRRAKDEIEREEVPGPFEIMQDFMVDELIEMDMERAKRENEDPLADARTAEELTEKAREIYQAGMEVPPDVRVRLWPEMGAPVAAAEQVLNKKKDTAVAFTGSTRSQRPSSPGLQRAELKAAAFKLFDADGDGLLYDPELRKFARNFGFDGGDAEWAKEYSMICSELGCSAMEGIDLRAFSRLIDNEEGCYLTDADLASILGESGALPRAGQ